MTDPSLGIDQSPLSVVFSTINGWIERALSLLPNIMVAVSILLIFWLLAILVRKAAQKVTYKVSESESLSHLVGIITYTLVLISGLAIALSVLELSKAVTSILAGAGIIGLALGFAFQDLAANFISGAALALRKPFQVGDYIETDNTFGKIESIELRNTTLKQVTGETVLIPNKVIFQNKMTNYSTSGIRRIDVACGVEYSANLEQVRSIAYEAIRDLSQCKTNKDPEIFFTEFADSSINFVARFWIDYGARQVDFVRAQSDAIMAIKSAFDQNDINIPFPIRTVYLNKE